MKKQYEAPKAEMLVFNYQETVVASGIVPEVVAMDGKTGNAANACYTHNGNNVNSGCPAIPKT